MIVHFGGAKLLDARIAASNFQKRTQLLIGLHNKTLSVAAMRVRNRDRSPARIHR
jgi:hypothetical protein